MGRSDYLVSAGIGFDLDRSSARKSIGIFEGIAGALNTVATKKAAEGMAATEKEYENTLVKLKKANDEADDALIKGTDKSAKAAQEALNKSMMKPPSRASKGAIEAAGGLAKYKEEYKKTVAAMKGSYVKFAKEAEKLGIKFSKGSKMDMEEFAKKDAETRKRAINLTKRMIKDENNRLKTLTKGSKAYDELEKEIKQLANQEKEMINLHEDVIQLEKKNQKIKRKTAKDERKAEKKKLSAQKKIVLGLKNIQQHTKKLGQITSASAAKIKAGLQNAFVIGTAAATAFFYKMQPIAEAVTDFEKTLINANSVFNVTKDVLFEVSDTMVDFTLKYGVSAQDTATGLYQLASAGLSAAESQEVLQSTMKLAMATQGDHNTLAKLTVQTIMGFGMEMSDAGELTDKFAHAIQKSLIEWQDLASSVKFAMPFFVATGQSVDELLGGLEVLTNRALEAGIAGRGLRQALAQFAKHANDNASALSKLGVEIMDTEGNMRALHDIALDAQAAFGDVSDVEALTAMLEDMNVRGATAFALLVQNAEEFEGAVENLANSAGEATQMADIQQQSLANQIQLVKNALLAPFLFADDVGKANDTLNTFTFRVSELVEQFVGFFIISDEAGERLTKNAENVKEFVLAALDEAIKLIVRFKEVFLELDGGLTGFIELLEIAVKPLHLLLDIIDELEPSTIAFLIKLKMFNSIMPVTNMLSMIGTYVQMQYMAALIGRTDAENNLTLAIWQRNAAEEVVGITSFGSMLALGGFIAMMSLAISTTGWLSDMLVVLAGAFMIAAAASLFMRYAPSGWTGIILAIGAITVMYATLFAVRNKFRSMMESDMAAASNLTAPSYHTDDPFARTPDYDSGGTFMGGRMYDMGGPTTEHGMAILQKGETVIPKTRNMLEGGITLNIAGDIVTDNAEDFAERIAEVLPLALRRQNDIGGI